MLARAGGFLALAAAAIASRLAVARNDKQQQQQQQQQQPTATGDAKNKTQAKTTTTLTNPPPPSFLNIAAPPKAAEPVFFAGLKKEGLPTFTFEEVQKHNSIPKRIWVTYREGVYDVTDFVDGHPGGSKILLAAGGSIDGFWSIYEQHQKVEVQEILETMRIGNFDKASVKEEVYRGGGGTKLDTYDYEPQRHPALRVISKRPFNAETPPEGLESHITPNEIFFVRNHLAVPFVDESTYMLEIVIEGSGKEPTRLSLHDLKTKFPQHTQTVTIQCGGNRRQEMIATKWVQGIGWNIGGIGTAAWTGPTMRDVLRYAGYNDDDERLMHVQFEGLDCDSVCCYGASVPIEKVMGKFSGALFAHTMNGQPLPRDHGFPLRAIVPGVVGSRTVKFLSRVVVSEQESQSFWQQRDYKLFSPSANYPSVDFSTAPSMQEMPVQSAIISPADGTVLDSSIKSIGVSGYAWSGGGRSIVRVDVSIDGGRFWHTAQLQPPDQKDGCVWAWTHWKCDIPIPPELRNQVEIVCKAVDSNYTSQPEGIDAIWNMRGLNNNAWHRIQVWLPREKYMPPKPKEAPPPMTPAVYVEATGNKAKK